MLGFDAIGRLALGQISKPSQDYRLTAVVGTFTMTGIAALFAHSMISSAGSYSFTGYAAGGSTGYPSSTGAFVVNASNATLTFNQLWTEKSQETEVWTEKVYGA